VDVSIEEREYLKEYPYTGITGMTYIPFFFRGNWFIIPGNPISFLHMVYMCKIPDDEALLIKLRFGQGKDLQT